MHHLFALVKPKKWQAVLKRVVECNNVNMFQMVFEEEFKNLSVF